MAAVVYSCPVWLTEGLCKPRASVALGPFREIYGWDRLGHGWDAGWDIIYGGWGGWGGWGVGTGFPQYQYMFGWWRLVAPLVAVLRQLVGLVGWWRICPVMDCLSS